MQFFKKPPFWWKNTFQRNPMKKPRRDKLWNSYTRELKTKNILVTKFRSREINFVKTTNNALNIIKRGKKLIDKYVRGCLDLNVSPGLSYVLDHPNLDKGLNKQLLIRVECDPWLSLIVIFRPTISYNEFTNKIIITYPVPKQVTVISLDGFNHVTVIYCIFKAPWRTSTSYNLPFKIYINILLYTSLFKKLLIAQDFYFRSNFKYYANANKIFKKTISKYKKNKKRLHFKKFQLKDLRKQRRWFDKYTIGWFRYQNKKFKRFKSKFYFWKMHRRRLPFYAIYKSANKKLIHLLFAMYSQKILKASTRIKNWTNHKVRIKNLLKNIRKKSKNRYTRKKRKKELHTKLYEPKLKVKTLTKNRVITKYLTNKPLVLNFVNPHIHNKYRFKKLLTITKKLFSRDARRGLIKIGVLSDITKLNLLNRLLLKKIKKTPKVFISKKTLLSQVSFKKANSRLTYKLKWMNHYEFKSFRWKFYKKRWYYTISKWKRLLELRRMVRKAWRSYRKLQKNFLFIKLLRANFKYVLGLPESSLLINWLKIRRGTNTDSSISTVNYFNQSLQLKLDSLSLFLGLAPNRFMAQELVSFGGFRVNGTVITKKNFSISNKDIVQVDLKVNHEIRSLYKKAHWNSVHARVKFAQFLQVQWSLMLFMMVRWPNNYELASESILNLRWVRFFIRYFPVRIAKYKKAKTKWYKY